MDLIQQLKNAILDGETEKAQEALQNTLDQKISYAVIIDEISSTLEEVGQKYANGVFFLPDLILAGEAAKSLIDMLIPYLKGSDVKSAGVIVLGTVEGDVHDIGKTLVLTMLTAAGFTVYDLGVNIEASSFIEKAKEYKADIIAASALLSTTKDRLIDLEKAVASAGLKGKIKTMVGGAVVSQKFADEIGADGYSENAAGAIAVARKLML